LYIDGELKAIDVTKDLTIDAVLEERHPLGLNPERQKYILENIIQYVQNPDKKAFFLS